MMDKRPDGLTARGRSALLWCLLLAPLIRQLPSSVVPYAGSASWLSVLLAVPPLLLGLWLLTRILRRCRNGEGLGELMLRALGDKAGRLVVFLYTLWLSFYAGFVLRAGADRFVAAVYTTSPIWLFAVVMLALAVLAGLGRLRVLGRCAEIASVLLGLVFLLVFVFALPGVESENLLPLTRADLPGALRGVPPVLGTFGIGVCLAFSDRRDGDALRERSLLPSILLLVLLGFLLCVTTVGTFGAELTDAMNYPFFVMIRGIHIFHLLERIEALIIAQWVAADFLLLGVLLRAASDAYTLAFFGAGTPRKSAGVWFAAALAAVSAWLCAPSAFALHALARDVVPKVNAVMLAAAVLICLLGRLKADGNN